MEKGNVCGINKDKSVDDDVSEREKSRTSRSNRRPAQKEKGNRTVTSSQCKDKQVVGLGG